MAESDDSVQLVLAYVEAAQRARRLQEASDWSALRRFLASDVVFRMASPWTEEPWRIVLTSADQAIDRLRAPNNRGSSLTTKNVNVQRAGADVMVEQLSTITTEKGRHVSMVCHIFSVHEGVITAVRSYRNDSGLPNG
jgi:ketosteroid isomerase-like protein